MMDSDKNNTCSENNSLDMIRVDSSFSSSVHMRSTCNGENLDSITGNVDKNPASNVQSSATVQPTSLQAVLDDNVCRDYLRNTLCKRGDGGAKRTRTDNSFMPSSNEVQQLHVYPPQHSSPLHLSDAVGFFPTKEDDAICCLSSQRRHRVLRSNKNIPVYAMEHATASMGAVQSPATSSLMSSCTFPGSNSAETAKSTAAAADMINVNQQIDADDGSRYIDTAVLKAGLVVVGCKIVQNKVRVMVDEMDADGDGRLSFDEFDALRRKLNSTDIAGTFGPTLTHARIESHASSEGTTDSSVQLEEQVAFSNWINSILHQDPDCEHLLPIDEHGMHLYDKVADGILMCKLINLACPGTIVEHAINKKSSSLFRMRHENVTLAVNSAQSIGCNIVNIDVDEWIVKPQPLMVLGLLWQIIRIGLFNQITLEQFPGMIYLLRVGEKIEHLMRLAPEQILLRWVNYHLKAAGIERRMNNFTSDVKDSEVYTHLLHQLAKNGGASLSALQEPDMLRRAELMLNMADKMKCRSFVTRARDVVKGTYKLNVAFVANLFSMHPGLPPLSEEALLELNRIVSTVKETREEKAYRNWLNSVGVNPFVYHFCYTDLSDGLVIFQLYDIIKPGIVDWNKVVVRESDASVDEKVQNCNYAVQLGKRLNFWLEGITGERISQGNSASTMALIWQLMRAYTLRILNSSAGGGTTSPIAEEEIIGWANSKLKASNKSSRINSFEDASSLSNAMPIIDLLDAIKPGSIRYDRVINPTAAGSHCDDDRLGNAQYAISIARKCGALCGIYATPEDIVECKPNMVMTVFACLMSLDYNKPGMNLKKQQTMMPISQVVSNFSTPPSSVESNTESSYENLASESMTNTDAVTNSIALSASSSSSSRAEITSTTMMMTETVTGKKALKKAPVEKKKPDDDAGDGAESNNNHKRKQNDSSKTDDAATAESAQNTSCSSQRQQTPPNKKQKVDVNDTAVAAATGAASNKKQQQKGGGQQTPNNTSQSNSDAVTTTRANTNKKQQQQHKKADTPAVGKQQKTPVKKTDSGVSSMEEMKQRLLAGGIDQASMLEGGGDDDEENDDDDKATGNAKASGNNAASAAAAKKGQQQSPKKKNSAGKKNTDDDGEEEDDGDNQQWAKGMLAVADKLDAGDDDDNEEDDDDEDDSHDHAAEGETSDLDGFISTEEAEEETDDDSMEGYGEDTDDDEDDQPKKSSQQQRKQTKNTGGGGSSDGETSQKYQQQQVGTELGRRNTANKHVRRAPMACRGQHQSVAGRTPPAADNAAKRLPSLSNASSTTNDCDANLPHNAVDDPCSLYDNFVLVLEPLIVRRSAGGDSAAKDSSCCRASSNKPCLQEEEKLSNRSSFKRKRVSECSGEGSQATDQSLCEPDSTTVHSERANNSDPIMASITQYSSEELKERLLEECGIVCGPFNDGSRLRYQHVLWCKRLGRDPGPTAREKKKLAKLAKIRRETPAMRKVRAELKRYDSRAGPITEYTLPGYCKKLSALRKGCTIVVDDKVRRWKKAMYKGELRLVRRSQQQSLDEGANEGANYDRDEAVSQSPVSNDAPGSSAGNGKQSRQTEKSEEEEDDDEEKENEEEEKEYAIESIGYHWVEKGKPTLFFIKWVGFEDQPTWEPEDTIQHTLAYEQYCAKHDVTAKSERQIKELEQAAAAKRKSGKVARRGPAESKPKEESFTGKRTRRGKTTTGSPTMQTPKLSSSKIRMMPTRQTRAAVQRRMS